MINREKCDPLLGEQVFEHMVDVGLETPTTELVSVPREDKLARIEPALTEFVETLGLDLDDDSIQDTPRRLAKMYVDELTWGLNYNNFPKCTRIENKMNYKGSFVLERDVQCMSLCEHHFVTIDGLASIAYIPDQYVLGLSKLNRIAQFFSRRPQVQERLTEQIADSMMSIIKPKGVGVKIEAKHNCMVCRGVQKQNSSMITTALRGNFKEPHVKQEFQNGIK